MLYTSQADIERLQHSFEDCTLQCSDWTHAAHLTVALWYVAHNPLPEALHLMREGINRYNPWCGFPTRDDVPRDRGYHESLTVFYIWAVYDFYIKRATAAQGQELWNVANMLCTSRYAEKTFPLDYYTKDVLFSQEARLHWVEPDIMPIDDSFAESEEV